MSGPVVALGLALELLATPERHYTYRFVWAPETIGAITYARMHLDHLKAKTVAAFNLTCIGDDRAFTYLASRNGNLRIDRIAKRIIRTRPNAREYSYLERGSDERHYGAPGIDLPMISLMRSRYADYPEYHTSLDDLDHVVTPSGLHGGLELVFECIQYLESTPVLQATQLGEPQLGKRGLYHTLQGKSTPVTVMLTTDILAFADGQHDFSDIAEITGSPSEDLQSIVEILAGHGLVETLPQAAQ